MAAEPQTQQANFRCCLCFKLKPNKEKAQLSNGEKVNACRRCYRSNPGLGPV
jgi:hypothetical protein